MISHDKLETIVALVAEGKFSQRAIARKVGVSRNTVAAIVHKRRDCYQKALQASGKETADGSLVRRRGRCPLCRAVVLLPCLACLVRQLVAAGALRRLSPGADEPLRLELRAAEWRRYLRIRLQRELLARR